MTRLGLLFLIGVGLSAAVVSGSAQVPGSAIEPHQRVEQAEVPGRRADLVSLKGARLFSGPSVKASGRVPLVVHFHGAPWLVETLVARHLPKAALITVQLGAGSSVYGRPFQDAELFSKLIDEARGLLGLEKDWSSITLTGFSAGYGAIRAILRQEENYRRVDNVLLLDGIHAGYVPDGKPVAEGGAVNAADLDSFLRFSRDAAAREKTFVITHSQIFPGSYASTSECTDNLLRSLQLKRRLLRRPGPMGMTQLSSAARGRFMVFGYSGETAPDHVDHLHAMHAWFRHLRVR